MYVGTVNTGYLVHSVGHAALSVEFRTVPLISFKFCRALPHFLYPHLHLTHQLQRQALLL